jgi:DNA-binding Lrp family transcriptional regulator
VVPALLPRLPWNLVQYSPHLDVVQIHEEDRSMVNAIVLIQTTHGKINNVAEQLAEISEISEVYSVGGSFDVIAIIRVHKNEDIADLVTEKMQQIDGIERTETMIAFKAYSRHDLDGLFSIGLEN